MTGVERKILGRLAQFGPMPKHRLAIVCQYKEDGGAFTNPLGSLRSKGYITPARVEPIAATEAGLGALGDYERLPEGGDALFALWIGQPFVDGPMRRILQTLREAGGGMDRDKLAEALDYAADGGAFTNPLGRLRSLGLVSARGRPELAAELMG
jgi:hypothetical protein